MSHLIEVIIGGLVTLAGSVLASIPALSQKTRRKQRALAAQVDALQEWAYSARQALRRHNLSRHPGGDDTATLPDLPDWMSDDADE